MSTGVWGGKGCDLPPTGKEEEQQGAGDSLQCREDANAEDEKAGLSG